MISDGSKDDNLVMTCFEMDKNIKRIKVKSSHETKLYNRKCSKV